MFKSSENLTSVYKISGVCTLQKEFIWGFLDTFGGGQLIFDENSKSEQNGEVSFFNKTINKGFVVTHGNHLCVFSASL